MNVAVQSFEESVGKSRAHLLSLVKIREDVAQEDVFNGHLACATAVQVCC